VQRLSIGDFSRITHLSIKTLRRYHEAGLLVPAEVDERTGYRYYRTAQVPTAQVIRRFRELGMPVRELAEVVGTADPAARTALIADHLDRLERQLEQTQAAVSSVRRLLHPAPAGIEVELRLAPAITAAGITEVVELHDVLSWYSEAMLELDAALASLRMLPTGPPGGLYANALFSEERGEATVYLPLADPPRTGRVAPLVIPPSELAVTMHHGAHNDIDVSYGELGSYVAEHAMAIAGPVRETYLVGPRNTPDETAWRTEIGWPIFATSID
jgi:DNA-binding transcriptional MerR regulator